MKKILLTGGGTAGHVTPNIALLPVLKEKNYDVLYVGSYSGIESQLIPAQNISYKAISSGKLRRYVDFKNISDPFRVLKGMYQAYSIIKKYKPDIVFSKGGYVAVPVVVAAYMRKIPVIIHESDISPGLANKICMRFAKKICCNFPETLNHLPKDKAILTGSPIRNELLHGDASAGKRFAGINNNRAIILVIGGSLGSVHINEVLRATLDKLTDRFNVVHVCGKGNIDHSIKLKDYIQFEYISEELKDVFAMANIIISRAGANSICEILALRKPNILIPLSKKASRGDQILNAQSYKKQGYSYVLDDDSLDVEQLCNAIDYVYKHRDSFIASMQKSPMSNGIEHIIDILETYSD